MNLNRLSRHLANGCFTLIVCYQAGPAITLGDDEIVVFDGHQTEVNSLAFHPDGNRILSTGMKKTLWWDPTTGKEVGDWRGLRGHAVAFDATGERVAISEFQTTVIYKVENMEPIWTIDAGPDKYSPPFIADLEFSPDGGQLATVARARRSGEWGLGSVVQVWDTKTHQESWNRTELRVRSDSLDYSADGQLLTAGAHGEDSEAPKPGTLYIWRAANGLPVQTLKVKEEVEYGDDHYSMTGVAFHPNGKQVATASSDQLVRLWDVSSGEITQTLRGHTAGVRRVAFSPDGLLLASAGDDRQVILWDLETGKEIRSFPLDVKRINALAFSPDGRRLAMGGGDFLRDGKLCVRSIDNQ